MQESFSWEGEDVLAAKICGDVLGIAKGIYVDIGAHHPHDLSNTELLYRRGWRGINIDATPGSMEAFREHRPEDINIECGIGREDGIGVFHLFANGTLNGFLGPEALQSQISRGEAYLGNVEMQMRSIASILSEHNVDAVDLLNIDVEGMEAEIMAAWPHDKLPRMIICEVLGANTVRDVLSKALVKQIEALGYDLVSRLHFSCIFMRRI